MNRLKSIKQRLEEAKKLKAKSTRVVGWYAHPNEVRGPYHRWITPQIGDAPYQQHLADISDECEYIAFAMNEIPTFSKDLSDLIAAYEVLEKAVNFIQDRNDLMFAECSDAEEIILACREALSRANKILNPEPENKNAGLYK